MAALRKFRRYVYFLLILLLLLFIKEYANPSLILMANDYFHPSAGPLTAQLQNGFAVSLYAGTRPHTGRIATLQKGLIVSLRGQKLIEEGYGLGLPIVHKNGVPYLASRSQIGRSVRGDTTILYKIYFFDTIETETELPRLRYRRKKLLAKMRIDYLIVNNQIDVRADLRYVRKIKAERVFFMNELSGSYFRYGVTDDGTKIELLNWQIAPYAIVGLNAPRLGVTVWLRSDPTWTKFLGREMLSTWKWYGHVKSDWAGCEILVDKPLSKFQYTIVLQNTTHPFP